MTNPPSQSMPEHELPPRRIACVGASITFGLGLEDRRHDCYPAVLQRLLDHALGHGKALVRNFGFSGATAARHSNEPYWETPSFTAATRFRPHRVLIMLGTNDAQHANAESRRHLARDFADLVEHFRAVAVESNDPAESTVLISQPPPAFPPVEEIDFPALAYEVRPLIERVAEELDLPLVDFFTPLTEARDHFPDGLHPNAEITEQIAQIACEALLSNLR